MKNCIKKIFLSALSLMALSSVTASDIKLCVIYHDHTEQAFTVSDDLKVSFDESQMYVSDAESTTNFAIEEVKGFYYKTNTSGISATEQAPRVEMSAASLSIHGLAAGTEVCVYDMGGSAVRSDVSAGDYSLDLRALPKGIYIVKYGPHRSIKISVK